MFRASFLRLNVLSIVSCLLKPFAFATADDWEIDYHRRD